MDEYRRLYESLRLPQAATDIALGTITLPPYDRETPFDAYGFLPALLPHGAATVRLACSLV